MHFDQNSSSNGRNETEKAFQAQGDRSKATRERNRAFLPSNSRLVRFFAKSSF